MDEPAAPPPTSPPPPPAAHEPASAREPPPRAADPQGHYVWQRPIIQAATENTGLSRQ